ncbi:hypothetical protein [Microbacterium sp.]|uniref:hypothetical protein n=1 Tax=Microbacterium sp. TaxID=51671 RepID=UPI002811A829|nr:hypothetical protein [Microbacterium sp.]
MGNVTGKRSSHPDSKAGGKWFKGYLVWLTFPLPILNTDRVPREYRNKWYLNVVLGITALLFIVLGAYQAVQAIGKVFGWA